MKVAIIMGSNSDWPILEPAEKTLKEFGVEVEVVVASAHRTPDQVHEFAAGARDRGVEAIIAAAGLAAHLGGVIAAYTTLPVIGIPISGGPLKGMDALLSFVQMPSGVPVATMAIDGAKNAAIFAVDHGYRRGEERGHLCRGNPGRGPSGAGGKTGGLPGEDAGRSGGQSGKAGGGSRRIRTGVCCGVIGKR